MKPTHPSSGDAGYKKDYPKTGQRVFQTRKDARPVGPRPVDNSSVTGDVPDTFEGVYKYGKNGIGYVTHKDSGFAVMIQPQHSLHAINGDRVAVTILDKKQGTGSVSEIIKRGKTAYAGIIEARANDIWFVSSDVREPEMRVAPLDDLAKNNHDFASKMGYLLVFFHLSKPLYLIYNNRYLIKFVLQLIASLVNPFNNSVLFTISTS
jgi:exoribonuclease R